MRDSTKFPQNIWANLGSISMACERIERVGGNLYSVGLERPADELRDCAETLRAAIEAIQNATSRKIDDDFKAAQQATANMMNGILATAERAEHKGKKA